MTARCKRRWSVAALALAVHIRIIDTFLSTTERCALAQASRLARALHAHAGVQQTKAGAQLEAATQPATIAALHASLVHASCQDTARKQSRQRRRNGSAAMTPTAAQLSLVLRDLALVAQGVRTSCLVDSCALKPAFAALLLQTLVLPEWRALVPGASRVVALVLDSNVFFVNYPAFLAQKCVDLASQLRSLVVVNVSAHLPQPALLVPSAGSSSTTSSKDTGEREDALMDAIAAICDQLIDAVLVNKRLSCPSARHLVLELADTRVSSTALAGVVLCYPAVYDLYDPSATSTDSARLDVWDAPQTNCLSACPLAVLQTFVASEATPDDPEASAVTLLQEFSVPMCVLQRSSHDASEFAPAPTTLALLRATSKCRLTRALAIAAAEEESTCGSKRRSRRLGAGVLLRLDSAVAGVRVAMRTLDRVAL